MLREIETARVFKPLLEPARYKGAYGGRGSGKSHFFGDHPEGLYRNPNFTRFDKNFVEAAGDLPGGVEIVNATPGTAMTAFPVMELEEAIGRFGKDGSVHRDRAVPVADTN